MSTDAGAARLSAKRNGKLIIASLWMAMFSVGYFLANQQISLLRMAEEFGVSNTSMNAMVSYQYLAMIVMPIVLGRISDRMNKKILFIVQGAVFTAGMLCMATASSYASAVLGMCLAGGAYGILYFISIAIFSENFSESNSVLLLLNSMLGCVASTIAPFVARAIMAQGGTWNMLFVIPGVIFLVSTLCFIPVRLRRVDVEVQGGCFDTDGGDAMRRESVGQMFKNPVFILLCLGILLYTSAELGATYFVDAYFTLDIGRTDLGPVAVSLFWVMMIPSRIIASRKKGSRATLVKVSWLVTLAAAVVLFIFRSPVVTIICYCVMGFAIAPIVSILMGAVGNLFKRNSGFASSVAIVSYGLGALLFPMLLNTLVDRFGYGIMFLMIVLIAALGFTVFIATVRCAGKKKIHLSV